MNKNMIFLIVPLLLLLTISAVVAEQKVVMEIKGMTCNLCTLAVKKSLLAIKGVKDAKISYKEKQARLSVDESVTDAMLIEAVRQAGPYSGKVVDRKLLN